MFIFLRNNDCKPAIKHDSEIVYSTKEEPAHNTVFAYSYSPAVSRAEASAFHPVSPKVNIRRICIDLEREFVFYLTIFVFQILKNNVSAENQSPHEMWKGTNENNWIGSPVSLNSPVKLDPNVSRCSSSNVAAEILHPNQHWSIQNSEILSTTVSQPTSVHSIRLVAKPLTIPSNVLIKTSSGEVGQGE